MSESEALERYELYLWKQVNIFYRKARGQSVTLDDLMQEARIVFLQHIRTHDESEWAACTLTIHGALYDYVRKYYPLSIPRGRFAASKRQKVMFDELSIHTESQRYYHEDDHSAIDLKAAMKKLKEIDRQIISLKLQGWRVTEISKQMGLSHQMVSHRIKALHGKLCS